jgi:hypothetical protein
MRLRHELLPTAPLHMDGPYPTRPDELEFGLGLVSELSRVGGNYQTIDLGGGLFLHWFYGSKEDLKWPVPNDRLGLEPVALVFSQEVTFGLARYAEDPNTLPGVSEAEDSDDLEDALGKAGWQRTDADEWFLLRDQKETPPRLSSRGRAKVEELKRHIIALAADDDVFATPAAELSVGRRADVAARNLLASWEGFEAGEVVLIGGATDPRGGDSFTPVK